MNKQELVKAVQAEVGETKISATLVADVLEAAGKVATVALMRGDSVTLPGLGSMNAVNRAARTGRNPQTGEAIQIAAKKAAKFNPGKALKEALN